jgi:hypothetical protein
MCDNFFRGGATGAADKCRVRYSNTTNNNDETMASDEQLPRPLSPHQQKMCTDSDDIGKNQVGITTGRGLKKRCGHCQKKVGSTSIECQCGLLFCLPHRYPEVHGCPFMEDKRHTEREHLTKRLLSDKLTETHNFFK